MKLPALVLAFGLAGTLAAQTAPPPPASPAGDNTAPATDQPVQLDQFVVNGYSQSLAESLQAKRESDEDVQVITAQDASSFPDQNLAESLSHLPGITIDRLFGEGERVSILGTDPNLNRVLYNGEPVSSADWYVLDNASRQFNYLLISPDVISQAAVYESWEPSLLEGSIGGTVVVDSRDPLGMAPLDFSGSVQEAFNDRSRKWEPSENIMFAWHNDAKTLGLIFGAEDLRDYVRRDGVESLAEETQSSLGVGGALPGQPPGNWVTAEAVNSALFLQDRQHQGVNGDLAWKPNDNLRIDLNGLWVKQTMNNVNFSYYMYPGDNWSGLPNITNATVTNGVLNNYTINSAPLVIDAFNRAAQIVTQDYNAKIEYKNDDVDLVTNAGYTRATGGTQHQFFAEWFVFANANIKEGPSSSSFQVTGLPGVDPNAANLNSGADFGNSGEPSFDYGNIASNPEVDDEKWMQFDATFPIKGVLKDVKAGLRFSDHKAGETGDVVSVPGSLEVVTPLSAIGVGPAPSNYLSGLPGITSSMADHVVASSYGGVANFVGSLSAATAPGGSAGESLLQYFNSQPTADTAVFTATPTFTIDERITAGYAEADFASGPISGNFGVRAVETTTTSASYNLSTPTPTLMTLQNTYDNVLPAVNLVYDLGGNQLVRFSTAEVISRPNTSAEANYVELYDSTLAGVGGNADLKPYESTNFNADYEWYFAKNSAFVVDLFYRDISNYILNASNPEQWTDYSLAGHPTETYEISRPSNGGAATSDGISLAIQEELPCGLGANLNYTRTHTSSSIGALPYASNNEVNFSPYFENKWGLLRMVYSWRDAYITSSFNGTALVTTEPYTELDANAQINITKHFAIVIQALNLLDETYLQEFVGSGASLLADEYKFGRTYTAGIHWNF
ncbi:MAG TPA: TonB-dependent receptor [Opitutaceae bacterium]|jgi:iron complex outermembrane receptor protein|nr:TonB-dependent receptor [Opitutaceae bacterium]